MNRPQPENPSRGGFTLIELLVVIAIIALLVSMLLPSLRKARELAVAAVCAAHLHSVGTNVGMYVSEMNGHAPIMPRGTDSVIGGPDNALWHPSIKCYDGYTGIGLLIRQKCTELNRGLFCPSLKDDERNSAGDPNLGIEAYPDSSFGVATSYECRTYPAYYNDDGSYPANTDANGKYKQTPYSAWPSGKALVHGQLYKLWAQYGDLKRPPCHITLRGMNWLAVNGAVAWHVYTDEVWTQYAVGYPGTTFGWPKVQQYVDEFVDGIQDYD